MTLSSWIHVAMTPAQAGNEPADLAVVIDALRATTTIAALMDAGARSVSAVSDIARARDMARSADALLAGEVHGMPPEGFDLGNSPVEALESDVRGRDVVLYTTNGTRALCSAKADIVVAGALTNLATVARFAAQYLTIRVVCAGNHGGTQFALEDFAVAGALVALLQAGGERTPNDEARVAMRLVDGTADDPLARAAGLMGESEHAGLTRALGLGRDIDFACCPGTSSALPMVVASGEGWVRLEERRSHHAQPGG